MKKKIKRFLAVFILLLMSIILGSCSGSSSGGATSGKKENKLQEILKRGYLIVGTGSTNVPWHFKNQSGEYEGMDIEMGKILAIALFGDETKVKFVEQSADQRIPNLLSGKVDVCIQFMTITPARAQQIAFSVPYYTEGTGLILAADGKYKSYDELVAAQKSGEDITIAILQNADATKSVQTMIKGAKDDQYDSTGLIYQAVTSGRADAGFLDLSSIKWLATSQPELYTDSGFAFNPMNYGAGVRPDEQQWLNYINTVFIDSMTGSTYELYNTACEKWFGGELGAPPIGKPFVYRSQ